MDVRAQPLLALAPGAAMERGQDGRVRIRAAGGELDLGLLPGGVTEALALLAGGGVPEDVATQHAERSGGLQVVAHLHVVLARLARGGALHYVVQGPEGTLAVLEPTSRLFELSPRDPAPDRPLRLSRFAHLRGNGETLVLESPRARARLVLRDGAALPWVAALAAPTAPAALAARSAPSLVPAAVALVGLLARARLAVEVEPGGATEEELDPDLASWEFHDLLFHARSRRRLHGQRIGATYRMAGTLAPLPPVCPPAGPAVELPRPELERLTRADPPLAQVMERRRSIRESGERPITLGQLGELLYRCARVREVLPAERDEISSRPYPSGGARYPLELYATVNACEGLDPGLYHYDPAGHRLERRSGMTPVVQALLTPVSSSARPPQVLLTLSARFRRVSYKYESIAYAIILKDAGVLLQSLSLAATAMGLASCVVGHGDPDAFERAAGLDGEAESSVAEIIVGSLPSSRRQAW